MFLFFESQTHNDSYRDLITQQLGCVDRLHICTTPITDYNAYNHNACSLLSLSSPRWQIRLCDKQNFDLLCAHVLEARIVLIRTYCLSKGCDSGVTEPWPTLGLLVSLGTSRTLGLPSPSSPRSSMTLRWGRSASASWLPPPARLIETLSRTFSADKAHHIRLEWLHLQSTNPVQCLSNSSAAAWVTGLTWYMGKHKLAKEKTTWAQQQCRQQQHRVQTSTCPVTRDVRVQTSRGPRTLTGFREPSESTCSIGRSSRTSCNRLVPHSLTANWCALKFRSAPIVAPPPFFGHYYSVSHNTFWPDDLHSISLPLRERKLIS